MKKRLLILTSTNFSPFNGLRPNLPSYIQTKSGSAGFTNCAHTMSAASQNMPLFIKTDSIFFFLSSGDPSSGWPPYDAAFTGGNRSMFLVLKNNVLIGGAGDANNNAIRMENVEWLPAANVGNPVNPGS